MQRDLPASVRASLNAEASEDALLTFAEVRHPLLSEPLRVVTDHFEYIWQSATWHPAFFEFEAVTDTDRAPEARINLPVVDNELSRSLIAIPAGAQISIWVLTSADFDLSLDPREALSSPVPLMELLHYDLVDVRGNVRAASGRLRQRDYTQEPFPGVRATQSRCPALFE